MLSVAGPSSPLPALPSPAGCTLARCAVPRPLAACMPLRRGVPAEPPPAVGSTPPPRHLSVASLVVAAGILLGLIPYAYLPLASLRQPYLDTGDPETWSGFSWLITAETYARHLDSTLALTGGRILRFFQGLPTELGFGLIVAPAGLVLLLKGRRLLGLGLAGLAAFNVVLEAGQIVLPGSCVRATDAVPGDRFRADFAGLGSVSVTFG